MGLKRLLLLTVFTILILSGGFFAPRMSLGVHLSRPLLAVWPSLSFYDVGSAFRVSINLTEMANLIAYSIAFSYNTIILDATGATLNGTWMDTERGPEGVGYQVDKREVNDGLGRVNFEVFMIPSAPLSGSGVLLFVDFNVTGAGSTILNLEETQTFLVDSNFDPVVHDASDGVFTTLGPELRFPQSFFTYSPPKPILGDSVFFDASASFSPNGDIVRYDWDFDDGTLLSTTQTFTSHIFQNLVGEPISGTFNVTLEVTDLIGQRNSTSVLVTVNPLSAGRPPIARFFSTPSDPVVGETATFDASVSVDPDGGSIVNATWDFGDGATATGIVAAHAYSSAGFFNLRLIVFDDEDQNGTLQAFFSVTKVEVQLLDAYPGERVLNLRDGNVQTLYADVINTGGRTLNAYAVFHVTPRRGNSTMILSPVMELEVREEGLLSASYTPLIAGRYRVSVSVFFNVRSPLLTDPRWTLGPVAGFSFSVVGRTGVLQMLTDASFETGKGWYADATEKYQNAVTAEASRVGEGHSVELVCLPDNVEGVKSLNRFSLVGVGTRLYEYDV